MAYDRNDEKPHGGGPAGESAPDQEPTEKLVEVDDSTSAQRFKSAAATADSSTQSAWEPGVVEVEFNSEASTQVSPEADAVSPPSITSANADLSGLNQILRQHNLERAEPTFRTSSAN